MERKIYFRFIELLEKKFYTNLSELKMLKKKKNVINIIVKLIDLSFHLESKCTL